MEQNDLISIAQQEVLDLDWFACDLDGYIAHFATSGRGALPESVVASHSHRKELQQFFESCLPTTSAVRCFDTSDLALVAGLERFFMSFEAMSTRGLYSFDAGTERAPSSTYELMTRPSIPVSIRTLPPDIQTLLKATQLPTRFADITAVSCDLIGKR